MLVAFNVFFHGMEPTGVLKPSTSARSWRRRRRATFERRQVTDFSWEAVAGLHDLH
jgi:hypothetical protein